MWISEGALGCKYHRPQLQAAEAAEARGAGAGRRAADPGLSAPSHRGQAWDCPGSLSSGALEKGCRRGESDS